MYSEKRQQFYVGISNDVSDRLKRHNNKESLSTKRGAPWLLLHIIACPDKSAAMLLEAKNKKRGICRFLAANAIDTGL